MSEITTNEIVPAVKATQVHCVEEQVVVNHAGSVLLTEPLVVILV